MAELIHLSIVNLLVVITILSHKLILKETLQPKQPFNGYSLQLHRQLLSPNPALSKSSPFSVVGTCAPGNTIEVSGDNSKSTPCDINGHFSVALTATQDNTYNFSILQRNPYGVASIGTSFSWKLDTSAPASPTFTSPANPYTSNSNSINISLTCETATTVNISGADGNQSGTCTNGNFTYTTASRSSDGTYNYTFTLTDAAGNVLPLLHQQLLLPLIKKVINSAWRK